MWGVVSALMAAALPTQQASCSVRGHSSGAPGIPSGCHFLVMGVEEPQRPGGPAVGEFLVLAVEGDSVSGYGGAFFSERYDVRGHVEGMSVRLEFNDPYDPESWAPATLAWDPDAGAFPGWQPTSAEELLRLSGGTIPANGDACA